jgi:acetyltransferase
MSVRNLDKLFKPRSVALIGASPRSDSVGGVVARNLRRAGFAGELMLVNPHHQTIDGARRSTGWPIGSAGPAAQSCAPARTCPTWR